jgi:hypothetical protein
MLKLKYFLIELTVMGIRATQSIQGWGVDVLGQIPRGRKGMGKELKRLEVGGNSLNESSLEQPDVTGEAESLELIEALY